jgi:hypothetical protein
MVGERISVEVVIALPGRQQLVGLELDSGTTAMQAVTDSAVLDTFPECASRPVELAIWGKPVEPGTVLNDGDRVEILRPLAIDPREARRRLAEKGGVMGGG